ncbi:FABP4 [Ramazzottius varieornatus]|uniref:FABP4 n=1 Tax=Ramazzottius varieornatus TaxID=947166 RepID=A0A1D1USF8_RAMVA|nr:FABP4 [Ramazzottius varieornatus]
MAAPNVAGKYELANSTGFDEYLRKTGASAEQIEIGKQLKPVIELSKDGEEWTMKINTEVMNKEMKFKIGQEFTEKTPSGKTIRSTITQQGSKLVQKQIFEDEFIANVEYTFTPEGTQLDYKWDGGNAQRTYKRL